MDTQTALLTLALFAVLGGFAGFLREVSEARQTAPLPTIGGALLSTFDGASVGFLFGVLFCAIADPLLALLPGVFS